MRLVFLNPGAQAGGAELCLVNVLAGLRRMAPDWPLQLICSAEGPLLRKAQQLGVSTRVVALPADLARIGDAATADVGGRRVGRKRLVWKLLRGFPAVASYTVRLNKALTDFSPNLIHTNGAKMHILGLWARPARTPVVWHIHEFAGTRPVMSRALRIHAKYPALAVCNSRSVGDDFRSLVGERIVSEVVYNGIDLDEFSPQGPVMDLDAACGLSRAGDGIIRVGLAATMALWKGHRVFLRAVSMLPENTRLRAYIVGGSVYQTDGSQTTIESLRQYAAELGIADRVGFTGHIQQRAEALRALDIVVHASTQPEPFGLVIVEAMACGRPTVASLAGGAAELVRPGFDAMGHSPGDHIGLAHVLTELAAAPALRQSLGREARLTCEARFNSLRMTSELIPLYRRAVQFSARAAGDAPLKRADSGRLSDDTVSRL